MDDRRFAEMPSTDDGARPATLEDAPGRVHPRRPRLLETCAVCRSLFDLRSRPREARGRHCSTTCLAVARRLQAAPPSASRATAA